MERTRSDVGFVLSGVPYHMQERNNWCGPAVVEQILDWDGSDVSQTRLADDMNTSSDGTGIEIMVGELNRRRPNTVGGPWVSVQPSSQRDFFDYLRYDQEHLFAGIFYVRLHTDWFPYLRYNHGNHYQTSAGYEQKGIKHWGGLVDPYQESYYRTGGNNTGGLHKIRVWRLWEATKGRTTGPPTIVF